MIFIKIVTSTLIMPLIQMYLIQCMLEAVKIVLYNMMDTLYSEV
jgi:hypothetical protein